MYDTQKHLFILRPNYFLYSKKTSAKVRRQT